MSLDMEKASTSTWFALRNPVFRSLWLASVLSGTFVSAQDIAATWLMHSLGASSLLLSLMATAAAAPFFIFTLPAGSVADIVNRRAVILCAVLWQGGCSALLALGAWTRVIDPSSVLICIFALGIGLAFSSPVWGAIVPDLVTKDELPSAITLGGVQLNLSGIVGPAAGGLLLPLLGARVWLLRSHVYGHIGPIAAETGVFHVLLPSLTDMQHRLGLLGEQVGSVHVNSVLRQRSGRLQAGRSIALVGA